VRLRNFGHSLDSESFMSASQRRYMHAHKKCLSLLPHTHTIRVLTDGCLQWFKFVAIEETEGAERRYVSIYDGRVEYQVRRHDVQT
jgi:hypothetical protein